jgi:hypothetical protein
MNNSAAIDTDHMGNTYVCGQAESIPSVTPALENMQAFIMKTDHRGNLKWNYLFYPAGENHTFCLGIAWAGDSSVPPFLGDPVIPKHVVFVGYTNIVQYYTVIINPGLGLGLGNIETRYTLSAKCFIAQILDTGLSTTLFSFLLSTSIGWDHYCI